MSAVEAIRGQVVDEASAPISHQPAEEEIVVMQMVARGLKDHTIARRLGVSIVTVRRRARRFRNKVGAANRFQAIAVAASQGWLSLGDDVAPGGPSSVKHDQRDEDAVADD